jgi:phage tail-like protein
MAVGQRPTDPYRGFRFKVQIDGITKAGFREVSGLDAATDAVDYRDGDEPTRLRKLPGLQKFSNITLIRGATDDLDLWKWRKMVMDGKIKDARKNVQIILLDDEGKEAAEWTCTAAWPTKLTFPKFNATANDVSIDTFELTFDGGIERVK